MTVLELVLTVGAAVDRVLAAAPVWGPVLLVLVVWRLWPTGRRRKPRTPRTTAVRTPGEDVRTPDGSDADTITLRAVTSADTHPDTSGHHRPDGPDTDMERGEW